MLLKLTIILPSSSSERDVINGPLCLFNQDCNMAHDENACKMVFKKQVLPKFTSPPTPKISNKTYVLT